jgi:drug/metabolite transporter (DMT)-like permease
MPLRVIARAIVLAICAGFGGVVLWRITQEILADPANLLRLALIFVCFFGPLFAASTPKGRAFVTQHPMRCVGVGVALLALGVLCFAVVLWAALHDVTVISPELVAYIGVPLVFAGPMIALQPALSLLQDTLRKPNPPARDPASTFE